MASEPEKTTSGLSGARLWVVLVVLAGVAGFLGAVAGVYVYREWRQDQTVQQARDDARSKKVAAARKVAPGSRYTVQFSTKTLFPRFTPGQRRYVTRCAPSKVDVQVNALDGARVQVQGSPAATGRFKTEARPVPGQDFRIDVSGAGNELDGAYTVRCLPVGFPKWKYERFRKTPEGEFVVAMRPKPQDDNRAWVIAFDQDGLPVWWFSPEINALWAQILPDGRLHWARGFGDGFGQDDRGAHDIATLTGESIRTIKPVGTRNDGHELFLLKNGNAMVMSYRPRYGVDLSAYGLGKNEGVLDGEIQELDPEGNVVWKWNSGDHVGLEQVPQHWRERVYGNPHTDTEGRDRYDTFHLNSIQQIGSDRVLISTRHTNAVYMLSKKTGEVLWKLGGTPTDESLKVTGPDPFRDQPLRGNHDARLDGNVLSVHDNRSHTRDPPRLVRYRIDAKRGTARFLSQYTDPKGARFSMCCGGARQFGTGWLVAWGNAGTVSSFDSRGKLAFRLTLPAPTYRAIPVPDSVTPARLDAALEQVESEFGPPSRAIRAIERFPRKQGQTDPAGQGTG